MHRAQNKFEVPVAIAISIKRNAYFKVSHLLVLLNNIDDKAKRL